MGNALVANAFSSVTANLWVTPSWNVTVSICAADRHQCYSRRRGLCTVMLSGLVMLYALGHDRTHVTASTRANCKGKLGGALTCDEAPAVPSSSAMGLS